MDSLVQIEWNWMPDSNKAVVLYARQWGDSLHGYREMGSHYAHESKGDMWAVRIEKDSTICAGPGQNNIERCAEKTFGKDYTSDELRATQRRLHGNLDYSLERSWDHVRIGLILYEHRWCVYRWYNNIEAKHNQDYPAWIVAWTIFLDRKAKER